MIARITDINYNSTSDKDFVIRRRYPTLLQLFIIFLSVVLVGMSVVLTVADKTALIAIIFILGGTTSWYVTTLLQRSRDQLLATEFQNALFSSALGMNHKFCFIIRRDGNIIYQDRSFQDMFQGFSRQASRSLGVLMDYGKVSGTDKDKIFRAIEQGDYEKVVFDICSADGKSQKIVMSMEPILRPSGFVLMRGREYIESRASDEGRTSADTINLFNKSTMNLFSSVMDMMNMGIYMINQTGQIIYINPTLLRWLEYTPDDLKSGALTLQSIMHSNGNKADLSKAVGFEGEMLLQKKTGAQVKCFITQKTLYDERNKMAGCSGIVQHIIDQGPGGVKPW